MPIGCPPPAENKKRKILIQQDFPLIELMTRIELVTSSLPMRCATDCATSACVKRKYDINISVSGMQDHFSGNFQFFLTQTHAVPSDGEHLSGLEGLLAAVCRLRDRRAVIDRQVRGLRVIAHMIRKSGHLRHECLVPAAQEVLIILLVRAVLVYDRQQVLRGQTGRDRLSFG